jgi:hypothetical protein
MRGTPVARPSRGVQIPMALHRYHPCVSLALKIVAT